MIDAMTVCEFWLVRALLAGGTILLIGRLAMMLVRQPARRAVFGIASVVASLLVVPLSFLPGWWKVSVLVENESKPLAVVAVEPERKAPQANPVGAPSEQGFFIVWLVGNERTQPKPADVPASPQVTERQQVAAVPAPAISAPESERPSSFWTVAVVLYGLIASCLFARLIVGHFALLKLWRTAHLAPPWAIEIFENLAPPVCGRAQLRVTSASVGPVCFGIVRPRVLIPISLLANGNRNDLRCVLAHELGHLSHRDPLSGWMLGLARVVYFMCPWLTGLRKDIRLAQEYLADAEAARLTSVPMEYAELLIRMVRSRPVPLGAAGVRGTNSELYWRVIMLLQQPTKFERHCPRRWQLAFGGILTALAIVAAGFSLQPRIVEAAEPEKKDPVKPSPKADVLKDAIDKIKKDVGDDPNAVKPLEDLLKALQKNQPGVQAAPGLPPAPLPVPIPPLGLNGGDFQKIQEQMLKQMEEVMRAAGARGGVILGPGGIQQFPGMGGGRLGARVERPSDVLVSQLDLPIGTGLVIVDVPAESTAGKIGIKPHDILLEIAGKSVSSQANEFVRSLKDVKEDAAIDIVVLRKGKKETLKGVKLPAARELPDLLLPLLPFFPDGALPFPIPVPVLPGLIPVGPALGPQPQIIGPGETVRVEQVNDAFTVFYAKKGVKVTVTGSKDAGGQPKAESIEVDDDGKMTKAESIEKLPKEYQELARTALKSIK